MAAAIGVRTDYTSTDLRGFARRCGDGDQVRRLLAVALILDGGSRSDAAKVAGVTLQIVRDWVVRFNEGGPDGLATRKAPGRTSILNDEQRAKLAEIVETGPIPAAHGVVRWRLCDLAQWIRDEFQLSVTRHTLGRELRALGYRKITARPGTVRISVCGRAVDHQAAMALMKRSPKMTANCAFAIVHSRGGIFHSFSDLFKIR
jgi:transposase